MSVCKDGYQLLPNGSKAIDYIKRAKHDKLLAIAERLARLLKRAEVYGYSEKHEKKDALAAFDAFKKGEG